ncbi:MAG: ABC transporter ATP-binding protein [Candidatus Kariarchaeaceae archaeon]
MSALIELTDVEKKYTIANQQFRALDKINLKINKGEFVLILGPSGSGKTTLLNQIGGIDLPDSGSVIIDGVDITKLSDKQLSIYRAQMVGWVFQFFNLIPSLNAMENVCLGLELARIRDNMEEKAVAMLETLGIGDFIDRFPSELSGGQQQRVALARALVKKPVVIIADEPTGNLDRKTGYEVVQAMKMLNQENKVTFVVVSHDISLIEVADRTLHIQDGRIIKEELE